MTKLPELLAPAGSPEALEAAIAGGADAVYFGTAGFNARMSAKNFEGDSLREAIDKCRIHGVKTNVTLNTLVHEREMYDLLRTVEELYTLGADALIVADLGAASLIKEYFPEMELHASTQTMGHNLNAARELSRLGFSRMVAARELSYGELKTLSEKSPIEIEMFIHGAICVSQSGGCLASSLIGGRSGNRGECAQPCRLPYKCDKKGARDIYALSLKDMCLASHIPEILSLGTASLKIEGRMKSPDYVYGVTSIYRRLLDEGRNATEAELRELGRLFSRSGFTDGYFTKKIDRGMLGIRTDADKAKTAEIKSGAVDYAELCRYRRSPIDMEITIEADKPSTLTATVGERSVTVRNATPDDAINRPITHDTVQKHLEKLGNSPFRAGNIKINLGDDLIMPLSAINSLRREAVERLTAMMLTRREIKTGGASPSPTGIAEYGQTKTGGRGTSPAMPKPTKTARFHSFSQIPDDTGGCDILYIPLEKFDFTMRGIVNGIIIPPVVFDSEMGEVSAMLASAKEAGVRHALVSNLGHLQLAKAAGMIPHGDFRLNIYNSRTAKVLLDAGFADLMASPELTLPQLRDLSLNTVIYGRIPLMTLEKCAIRELYSCEECGKRGLLHLVDRMGAKFPICRAYNHRNLLYNSVPLYMEDRRDELVRYRIEGTHYIFTDETKAEAQALLQGKPISRDGMKVRRIGK